MTPSDADPPSAAPANDRRRPVPLAFALTVASLVAVLAVSWQSASAAYPYYFVWDMDHVVSLDTLLIQSGEVPDHLHHTDFGLYLAVGLAQRLAFQTGQLSVLTFEHLESALNPTAGMAEHVLFIRWLSPWVCLWIALGLWATLTHLAQLRARRSLALLVYLGVQESLLFQACLIRSELYAAAYWVGAVVVLAAWVRGGLDRFKWSGGLAAGFLLGLSFLTKLQMAFLIVAFPLLLLWCWARRAKEHRPVVRGNGPLVLAASNFVIFSLGVLLASGVEPHQGAGTYTTEYGVNSVTWCVWLLFGGLAAAAWRLREGGRHLWVIHVLGVLALGFLLSFLAHFLVFADVAQSARYLLLDFKMLFLRAGAYTKGGHSLLGSRFTQLMSLLAYHPWLFLTQGVLFAWLWVGRWRGWVKVSKSQLCLASMLTLLAAAQVVVALRPTLNDLILNALLLVVLNVLYAAHIVSNATWKRAHQVALCALLGSGLFVVEVDHLRQTEDRMAVTFHLFDWLPSRWQHGVFPGHQRRYGELMNRRYTVDSARAGSAAAASSSRDLRDARFVFPSHRLNQQHVGPAVVGAAVWTTTPDARVEALSPALEGATVVDLAHAPRRLGYQTLSASLPVYSELTDSKTLPSDRWFVTLPRSDLNVFLLLEAADAERLLESQRRDPGQLVLTALRVSLAGSSTGSYLAVLLRGNLTVDTNLFESPYFGVVARPSRSPLPGMPALLEGLELEVPSLQALGRLSAYSPLMRPRVLGAALSSPNRWERRWAAFGLGQLRSASAALVPNLIAALQDPDFEVRREAVRALGLIGAPARSAEPSLQRLLEEAPALGADVSRTLDRLSED